MPKYIIIPKGVGIDEAVKELQNYGVQPGVRHEHIQQITVDISDVVAAKLSASTKFSVKKVKEIRPLEPSMLVEPTPPPLPQLVYDVPLTPLYGFLQPTVYAPLATVDVVSQAFSEIRAFYTPPLTGIGLTVAVLDTGIRKTHKSLVGKVIHEHNTSDSETTQDVWGHGTNVAYLICGEDGEHIGVSPGAKVMNIKVINDEGVATTETIVAGINHVIGLLQDARFQGLPPTNDMYPNIINISIGGEDDGDENDPIRVAVRTAVETWGIEVIAAAGNFGPDRTSITSPGSEPLAITVGGAVTGAINVWEKSSRGPTVQGDTKPDIITWATELVMASSKDDTSYETKSGTSFSTPLISGLTGLLWETGRLNMDPFTAQLYMFKWSAALEYAPYFCIKPADAAVVKDNNYGFGLPAGGAMVQQLSEGYGGQEDITTQLPSMIMMIMMMGLMVPMMR